METFEEVVYFLDLLTSFCLDLFLIAVLLAVVTLWPRWKPNYFRLRIERNNDHA